MEVVNVKAGQFMKKVVFPVIAVIGLSTLFYPLCVDNGVCDYLKLWIFTGIPFGIHRMFVWLVPRRLDIGGTVGVFAFNLLVGGVIGGVILIWRLLQVFYYLLISIGSAAVWITGQLAVRERAGLYRK